MDFVALILALTAYFVLGVKPSTHHDLWFDQLYQKTQHWFGYQDANSGWTISILILLPVAALALLLDQAEQILFGLPAFVLSVLVLLYSLGRKEQAHWLKRFQIAWRQGDLQGAYRYVSEILPEHQPNTETELYNRAFARLLYLSFTQYFAVIFWFTVLGAEGALLARLTQQLNQVQFNAHLTSERNSSFFPLLITIIEWPAARLLGLVMVILSQSFGSLNEWLKQLLGFQSFRRQQTEELQLYRMALCVFGKKLQYQDTDETIYFKSRFADQKEEGLIQLAELLQRSAVLGVVMLSLWVLLS